MNTDWFQKLFTGGRPYRRDAKVVVGTDAQGNPVFHQVDGRVTASSPDDSLDTIDLTVQTYLDCGCNARTNPIGGVCGEPGCGRVMCDKCWPRCRCADCGRPTCLACLHYFIAPTGERIGLCHKHYSEAKRRQFWKGVASAALRPFVRTDDTKR
jgi:hypothetical protein